MPAKNKPTKKAAEVPAVPITKFGKDHWSTFAYIETRCVDHKGAPELKHMRCNPLRHPAHNANNLSQWNDDYSSVLAGGDKATGHDDHDCAEDLEAAGLIKNIGTGLNSLYQMTEWGWRASHFLRRHKAGGGTFSTFKTFQEGTPSAHKK